MRNTRYDRDGILDAIRDGQPYGQISATFAVSRQVISRLAIAHGLRRQHNHGPESTCDGCGGRMWGEGLCKPCQDFYTERPASEGLSGGAWVIDLRRRVLVWQEAS